MSRVIETFASRDAAYDAAAAALADLLRAGLLANGEAALAGCGGSTPAPVYDRLSQAPLEWSAVAVTLVDERFVPPEDPDSNQALIDRHLVRGRAAAARIVPMFSNRRPEDAADSAAADIARLSPLDAVLLGMGEDGHFASLFAGSPALAEGLDLASDKVCIAVPAGAPAPAQTRLTLTLAELCKSAGLILLVTGDHKRAVIEKALADPHLYPVGALLAQTRAPLRILWAA